MSKKMEPVKLENGTMIRHKNAGYIGRIEGTTEIKECFTAGGELLASSNAKQIFQYRVAVAGESMRRIAPAEDLEVLEGAAIVVCPRCQTSFQSKPGAGGKPRGLCQCGNWICPACLSCQGKIAGSRKTEESVCLNQRKRLARKLAIEKRMTVG